MQQHTLNEMNYPIKTIVNNNNSLISGEYYAFYTSNGPPGPFVGKFRNYEDSYVGKKSLLIIDGVTFPDGTGTGKLTIPKSFVHTIVELKPPELSSSNTSYMAAGRRVNKKTKKQNKNIKTSKKINKINKKRKSMKRIK